MHSPNPTEFTALLYEWRQGNQKAAAQLVTLVYQDLRQMARHYLRQEGAGHTLQPTALVHEVYLRLFGEGDCEWRDRAHFFAVAAQQMRRILVDHARTLPVDKRHGHRAALSLEEAAGSAEVRREELIALDEALSRLEQLYPRASQMVELRFFCGMTEEETAKVLGISVATLKRDWTFARAWLLDQISGAGAQDA